jgi:dihydrofolate reductase
MKASVFVGTSLDGYLARPDGAYDFLPADGGEPHGYEEFFASVDALVIGRNTYEVVLPITPWIYGTKPVFVLSTNPLKPPPTDAVVERMSGTPEEIAAALAHRGLQHVYVDGGLTIQSFLRAGLIQRVTITRVPVLVGRGIPLFGPTERDIMLKHIATQHYASGLVKSEYEVVRPLLTSRNTD